MTVSEFCLHQTNVGELVVIRDFGYIVGTVWIDAEDLFGIPDNLKDKLVLKDEWDELSVVTEHGDRIKVPCHYVDIERS